MSCCQICKENTLDLHRHHIIPKSKGGTNDKSNLILVCIECHGKAHGVLFKGNKGLISEGIKRVKGAEVLADEIIDSGVLSEMLDRIEGSEFYNFLISGMTLGVIPKSFFAMAVSEENRSSRWNTFSIPLMEINRLEKEYKDIINASI
jgi:hypothetical protein